MLFPVFLRKPFPENNLEFAGAPGHGCGHNLLGVGAVGAAVALAHLMKKHKLPGTIKVLGTPAEEICAGKPFMASAGLFKGFDAIIDWHPYFLNQVLYDTCNAYFNVKYHFQGRTAHGNSPWEGRSALDAAILMGHAIELMREHIPPGEPTAANTINYTFSDVGPEYPNVVPDRSTLWCVGRFQTSAQMEPVLAQLKKCAEGAALATETKVIQEFITATHEKIPNAVLSGVMHRNLVALGTPSYSLGGGKIRPESATKLWVPGNRHGPADSTLGPRVDRGFGQLGIQLVCAFCDGLDRLRPPRGELAQLACKCGLRERESGRKE